MGCGCGKKSGVSNRNGLSNCSNFRNKLNNLKKTVLMKANTTLDENIKLQLLATSNEITTLLSNRYYCPTQEFIDTLTQRVNEL